MNKKMVSKSAEILYGLGDLASQFVWTFVGAYLTIYYTDIVGLAPAAISAIMLGARIWDAINDPMMGSIAERTNTKWGRFRPFIAFGSPFLALFGVLTFTNPFSGSSTQGVIWAAVTYVIAGMLYTMVNIPYGALAAVMTEDSDQLNRINTWRNVGMNLGMIIVNGLSAGLLLKFSETGAKVADAGGYTKTALLYSLISIPLFLIVFFTSRENVKPVHRNEKFSFKDTINALVKNRYLMILSGAMVLILTAFFGRLAVVPFYVIYDLGSFDKIATIMTIPSIGAIIGSIFIPKLIRRFGKRNTFIGSVIIQLVGLIVIYKAPFTNIQQIYIGCWIFGLSNIAFPISLSMTADSIDYMELKTGKRYDGTTYATFGLATKIGNAIGGSVGVLILSSIGYVANQQQTPEVMDGINKLVNLYPAFLYILGVLVLLLWDMKDSDADEIRRKLREEKEERGVEK